MPATRATGRSVVVAWAPMSQLGIAFTRGCFANPTDSSWRRRNSDSDLGSSAGKDFVISAPAGRGEPVEPNCFPK